MRAACFDMFGMLHELPALVLAFSHEPSFGGFSHVVDTVCSNHHLRPEKICSNTTTLHSSTCSRSARRL